MQTDPFLLPKTTPSKKTITTAKNGALWQAYLDKKASTPMLFPTEGAKLLGVSEFELLLSSPDSIYLGTEFRAVLDDLATLGTVQNIVRNEFAVHEKKGEFINLKFGEVMGLMINEGGLDLRLFTKHWAFVLALKTERSLSIGFYDTHGYAINKVFLEINETNLQNWQALCDKYRQDTAHDIELLQNPPQGDWQLNVLSDDKRQEFADKWRGMKDIHQYHGILTKLELDRVSSYHNAPAEMVAQVKPEMIEVLFDKLKETGTGIMVFVGSTGMIQIYGGKIHNIKRAGEWINILDDKESGFNLHLKDKALMQVWFVQRPHVDKKDGQEIHGMTMGLEAFDRHGNSIITLFGERVEGQKQDDNWQSILQSLVAKFKQ